MSASARTGGALFRALAVMALVCGACSADDSPSGTAGRKSGTGGGTSTGGAGMGGQGGNAGMGGSPATGGGTITTGGPIDPTGGRAGQGGSGDSGTIFNPDASDSGRTVTPGCAATKATSKDTTTVVPADIIFAIDSSGSMDEEISFVQMYMNGFSQQIVAAGVDARVILIGDPDAICIGAPLGSGTCPNDSKPPNYIHIPTGVDSNDALNIFISSYPQYQQHLRPNASKSFVVVTDDDATDRPNNSAAVFRTNLTALNPMMFAKWTFNGVYCFTECPDAAEIGRVYIDLVSSTMGVGGDLCLQNFQPVFDALAKKIITTSGSQIACEWPFPQPPTMGQSFSGDLVEVRRTTDGGATTIARVSSAAACAQGGWYFDSDLNPTKILACPSTCMQLQNQMGGEIDVSFGCEAVGSCVATASSTAMTAGACDWVMPTPPAGQMLDLTSVNVRYTSGGGFATSLGNVATAAACSTVTHGWYYDNPANPQKIVACPQTCPEVQAGGASAKVEVLFGCKTKPAPPR